MEAGLGPAGGCCCCSALSAAVLQLCGGWAGDRLAQVVLHLGEQEADWAEEALGEHFLQALELLLSSLEQASLPSHFNRR